MTGVTCEAGNAHSSGAPDFTLGGFMLFLFYLPLLPVSGQAFCWSAILVLFALEWTNFNVDECILGWGSNVVVFGLESTFDLYHWVNK